MRTVTALVAALGLLVHQAAAFMPASSGLRGKPQTPPARPRRSAPSPVDRDLSLHTHTGSGRLPAMLG